MHPKEKRKYDNENIKVSLEKCYGRRISETNLSRISRNFPTQQRIKQDYTGYLTVTSEITMRFYSKKKQQY